MFLLSRGETQWSRHLTLVVANGTGVYVIRADEWLLKHSTKCFCGVAVKWVVKLSAPFGVSKYNKNVDNPNL